VLGRADQLPRPQQDALLAASGMTEVAAPDCFLIALAVLELLSEIAEHAPLLIVADGAQWLDRSSAEVLAFVTRQSQTELLKTQLFLIEVPHCRPMEDLALTEKREPWQGQSQLVSAGFQETMQPRCVQRAETAWISPCGSR